MQNESLTDPDLSGEKPLKTFGTPCSLAIFRQVPFTWAMAEVFDLGGMHARHYHDGLCDDWDNYAMQGAHIAIEKINASAMLGVDQIRLKRENTINYHCWPDQAVANDSLLVRRT